MMVILTKIYLFVTLMVRRLEKKKMFQEKKKTTLISCHWQSSSQAPKVSFYILITLSKWKETGCLSNYLW